METRAIKLTDLQEKLDRFAREAEDRGDWTAWRYWRDLAHANRAIVCNDKGIDSSERARWEEKIGKLIGAMG